MQKWDYLVVQCDTLYLGFDPSKQEIIYRSEHMVYDKADLDPTVGWPAIDWSKPPDDWGQYAWRGKGDWSKGEWSGRKLLRIAWSPPRKCWTYLWKCLEDMGEEGWELVGTTPPLYLNGNGGNQIDFCLLFKRPSREGS